MLAACSVLPAAGPWPAILSARKAKRANLGGYVLIDLDERIASICNAQPSNSLVRIFSDQSCSDIRIGTGDTVSVTIWEAAAGAFFRSAQPDQCRFAVRNFARAGGARDGTIQVPYAGRIKYLAAA